MTKVRLRQRDERFRAMMRRLGVDLLEFAYARLGDEIAQARAACLGCANTAACSRWLSAPSEEPPVFCINLSRFEHFVARH